VARADRESARRWAQGPTRSPSTPGSSCERGPASCSDTVPRPAGEPYPNNWPDRVRNYYLAWTEIGWDLAPIDAHFRDLLGPQLDVTALLQCAREQAEHPLNVFDAVFCVGAEITASDAETSSVGIDWRAERLVPDPTIEPERRRLAGWREAVSEAVRRGYEHVLVLVDVAELGVAPPSIDVSGVWDLCLLSVTSRRGIDDGASSAGGLAVAVHARAYERA